MFDSTAEDYFRLNTIKINNAVYNLGKYSITKMERESTTLIRRTPLSIKTTIYLSG